MNGLTARKALDMLDMTPGATLGATGAAGAFGGYVVQLDKADGLRVIADASEAAGAGSLGNLAGSHDGRLASGRVWSGFRIVATLPMNGTAQNTSEPLDGVVGIRGRRFVISSNAA